MAKTIRVYADGSGTALHTESNVSDGPFSFNVATSSLTVASHYLEITAQEAGESESSRVRVPVTGDPGSPGAQDDTFSVTASNVTMDGNTYLVTDTFDDPTFPTSRTTGTFSINASRCVVAMIAAEAKDGTRSGASTVTVDDGTNGNLALTKAVCSYTPVWQPMVEIWYGYTSVSRSSVTLTVDWGTSQTHAHGRISVYALANTATTPSLGESYVTGNNGTTTAQQATIATTNGSMILMAVYDSNLGADPTMVDGSTRMFNFATWPRSWTCRAAGTGSNVTIGATDDPSGGWYGAVQEFKSG